MGTLRERVAERALGEMAADVGSVLLRQRGTIRMAPGKPWLDFEAEQVIDTRRPGFRWEARIRMAPGIRVRVVDAYEAGRGLLKARLWRIFPLATARGPEVDAGELLRYLAELPWCPPAYRSNPDLSFTQLDEHRLAVTVPGSGVAEPLVLTANDHADIVRVDASRRPRTVGKSYEFRPWSGEYADPGELGGMRVPRAARVTWYLDEGPFECFRGEIEHLRHTK